MLNNANVVIHRVNFDLQVRVALDQRSIRVLAAFELALQVHNLVFLAPNLDFQVLQLGH